MTNGQNRTSIQVGQDVKIDNCVDGWRDYYIFIETDYTIFCLVLFIYSLKSEIIIFTIDARSEP